jgi:hypothetical protein
MCFWCGSRRLPPPAPRLTGSHRVRNVSCCCRRHIARTIRFFQQPNALRAVHAGLEQLIEASGLRWTVLPARRVRAELRQLVGAANR